MEQPKYLMAAIADWKEKRISFSRLCEIFSLSWYEVLDKFIHEANITLKPLFDIPDERVLEILQSCKIKEVGKLC